MRSRALPISVIRRSLLSGLGLAFALGLAACGGGGGSSSSGGGAPVPVPSSTYSSTPNVTIALFIPTQTTSAAHRKPLYVSPATASVSVAVNGGTPTAINVASGSSQCVAASGGRNCTVTIPAALGSDTFNVVAWDAAGGTGNALSRQSIMFTVTAGGPNMLALTLNGVVSAVAVVLPIANPAGGLAVTLPVDVNAYDADNNIIVGPGVYVDASGNPLTITLTDSDGSGATHLSSTTLTAPATVTMTYSGAAVSNARIAPNVSSLSSSKLTAATLSSGTAVNGPALAMDPTASRHAISPYIYGITWFYNSGNPTDSNFAAYATSIKLPVSRHGGDATSRYNWQVDSSNAGNDWYFTAGNGSSTSTPSASVDHMITENTSTGTKQVLTIPTIEYINKSSPWHCGFSVAHYGAQQSVNPYVGSGDCGNGYSTSGTELVGNDPTLSDVANTPATQAAWVTHLVNTFGTAAHGGVMVYEMDNEVHNWSFMHRDVHPNAVTCDEIVAQTIAYAAAIKAVDPTAAILGPDDLPAADFFYCSDSDNNGQLEYPWYLRQMANYQTQHGTRLLDYLAWHYPSCCPAQGASDAYDATKFHITEHLGWIAANYPGTKLAYDEWNVGPPTDWPSTLGHADSLGLFGSMGVDLASFWGFSTPQDPTAFVFRMFRNYDGAGSMFGDTSVSATTADATKLTVYAAQRTSDSAKTVIVINKTAGALTAALTLSNATPGSAAHVYQYSEAAPTAIAHLPDQPFELQYLVLTYPANSVTTITFS